MQTFPKLLWVGAFLTTLASGAFGESAQQLLTSAQAAYLRGDIESAKRDFEMVVRLDPRNTTAIGYLRMIKAKENKVSPGGTQEKQLAAVMMPKVEFRQATLGSALDFLKQQVAKQTEGKVAVNFVLAIPDAQAKTANLTLSLTNVPFTEVLKYIGSLAGVSFSYEKYAITVRPAGAAVAPTGASQPGAVAPAAQ